MPADRDENNNVILEWDDNNRLNLEGFNSKDLLEAFDYLTIKSGEVSHRATQVTLQVVDLYEENPEEVREIIQNCEQDLFLQRIDIEEINTYTEYKTLNSQWGRILKANLVQLKKELRERFIDEHGANSVKIDKCIQAINEDTSGQYWKDTMFMALVRYTVDDKFVHGVAPGVMHTVTAEERDHKRREFYSRLFNAATRADKHTDTKLMDVAKLTDNPNQMLRPTSGSPDTYYIGGKPVEIEGDIIHRG